MVVVADVVVVLHMPPANDSAEPSHALQTLSEVVVYDCARYKPCPHSVIGEHSRSFSPGAWGLDSYSPTEHSSVVAQTVLDELVAGVAMYSVFLHSNALRHAVLLCDRSAW